MSNPQTQVSDSQLALEHHRRQMAQAAAELSTQQYRSNLDGMIQNGREALGQDYYDDLCAKAAEVLGQDGTESFGKALTAQKAAPHSALEELVNSGEIKKLKGMNAEQMSTEIAGIVARHNPNVAGDGRVSPSAQRQWLGAKASKSPDVVLADPDASGEEWGNAAFKKYGSRTSAGITEAILAKARGYR